MKDSGTRTCSATRKIRPLVIAIVCVAMLGAATVAGLVIRQIRGGLAVREPVALAEPPAQQAKEPDTGPQPTPPAPILQEEPTEVVQDIPQEMPEPEPQPQQFQPQMGRWGGGGPGGMEFFNNLSEEEQARLRQGVMGMFQRFQNMPEEERQAQMARFQGMQQRFQNMSDAERQQVMGQVQQQLDQWRQNGGSVEDMFDSLMRNF
jgi:hypothetical protein